MDITPLTIFKNTNNYSGFFTQLDFIRPFETDGLFGTDGTTGGNSIDNILTALNLGAVSNILSNNLGNLFTDFSAQATSVADKLSFTQIKEGKEKLNTKTKIHTNDGTTEVTTATAVTTGTNFDDGIGGALVAIINSATALFNQIFLSDQVIQSVRNAIIQSIVLPLPNDLPSDSIKVKWEETDMGILGTLFNKRESLGRSSGIVALGKISSFFTEKMLGSEEDNIIATLFKFSESASKIRMATKGIRMGDETDMVLLNGIERRKVSLEWNFVPNNETEMKEVMKIADIIKQMSLPSNNMSDFGIVYPSYVRLTIKIKDNIFYYIDEGVIDSVDIIFPQAVNGIWRYDGGASEVAIKIGITDRKRAYAEDYGYNRITSIEPDDTTKQIEKGQFNDNYKHGKKYLSVPNYYSTIISDKKI